ncbi:rubrerythrin-like domain-containing protein [Halorientalis halophila]
MPSGDPYSPDPPYIYECTECDHRVSADHQPALCPKCGARMADLSVPRE